MVKKDQTIEKEQTPTFTSFREKLQCYLTEDKSETSFSSVSALSFDKIGCTLQRPI